MNKKFYVTTPIYYVTAKPHLGSLYSTVLADILARWHKLNGDDVFFLTGTDEHGQKVAQAAQAAGKAPQAFVDSFIPDFIELWKLYSIDYTKFIRTTDLEHKQAVQQWLMQLMDKGDIYKADYAGWYCTPCETFLTETEVAGRTEPPCPSCNRSTVWLSEQAYFFKLSQYQDQLLKFYEQHHDFIQPHARLNEIISFVQSGLKDLCISRSTITWGIPFPNDNAHVTYVWADALNNYLTAIGYMQQGKEQGVAKWWPVDIQVMGKDIARFHAIYWPAFLMASGMALPHHLLVHGWITVDGKKMSKSMGNVVDPIALAKHYGVDQIRYYLASALPVSHDANFSHVELTQKINADLASELGNLLNRMLNLAQQNNVTVLPEQAHLSANADNLQKACLETITNFTYAIEHGQIHVACAAVKQLVGQCNAFFHTQAPWKQAKENQQEFVASLQATAACLVTIAHLLWPIMPTKMTQLLQALSVPVIPHNDLQAHLMGAWYHTFHLTTCSPLFERIEAPMEQQQIPAQPVLAVEEIDITDFAKSHLVVGTITAVQPVPKSDKLLQLTVDCGTYGIRTILSGVAKHFAPEDLQGKQALFVLNLKPRQMMGLTSHGMMLSAADETGKLQILRPGNPVPVGTRLS